MLGVYVAGQGFAPEYALFPLYPEVTGVLFFQAVGSGYSFEYLPNPCATKKGVEMRGGFLAVRPAEELEA